MLEGSSQILETTNRRSSAKISIILIFWVVQILDKHFMYLLQRLFELNYSELEFCAGIIVMRLWIVHHFYKMCLS